MQSLKNAGAAGEYAHNPWLRIGASLKQTAGDKLILALAGLLLLVWVLDAAQARASLLFLGRALLAIAPVLALSVGLAAAVKASGAEKLVSRAFEARAGRAILIASLAGALSPLCSCGVVPLIAGLLAAGVPLAPVMAFWLSSPVMDPVMFVLTTGAIGIEFAIAKTAAALFVGAVGGWTVHLAMGGGLLAKVLRQEDPELAARRVERLQAMQAAPVQWRFWQDHERRQSFFTAARSNAWLLGRWLALAFVLESLMLAYVPAERISSALGSEGGHAIALAVVLGIPAYLNGLAAIPLVGGLIELGMSPAVGLAFMVAGGMTSIPAAMAVWALVKPRVFALYIGLSLAGALASGYLYAGYLALR